MTVKAYLEIDEGKEFADQVEFEERPQIGEIITYTADGKPARAKVTGFEHREQVGAFVFTVVATREGDVGDWIKSMVS